MVNDLALLPLLDMPTLPSEFSPLLPWMISVHQSLSELRDVVCEQHELICRLQANLHGDIQPVSRKERDATTGSVQADEQPSPSEEKERTPASRSVRRRIDFSEVSDTVSWPTPTTPKFGGLCFPKSAVRPARSVRDPSTTLSWSTPAKEYSAGNDRKRQHTDIT